LLLPLLELFFPSRCLLCRGRQDDNRDLDGFCAACLTALPDPAGCCRRCGQLLPEWGVCPACRGWRLAFSGACAAGQYRGKLRSVIHRYKYAGHSQLAVPLGKLLARQVRRCSWPALSAVVPVPLHRRRLAQRGYDQSQLLAEVVAAELGIPLLTILERTIDTTSQTRFAAAERWGNVREAFAVLPGSALHGNILLVDDLLTTGATAHYAAQALLNSDAGAVYLAVVAR
jgi:ComF family protein